MNPWLTEILSARLRWPLDLVSGSPSTWSMSTVDPRENRGPIRAAGHKTTSEWGENATALII
jgi:hypothetical protein